MSQTLATIGPPARAWALYLVGFGIGLLGVPSIYIASAHAEDVLNALTIFKYTYLVAGLVAFAAIILLLLFGDRRVAGRPLFAVSLVVLLSLCAIALLFQAVTGGTSCALPFIAIVALFVSKPIIAQLFNPLVSAHSEYRPHRLYLFLMTSIFLMLGTVAPLVVMSFSRSSNIGLGAPLVAIAIILVVSAALTWTNSTSVAHEHDQDIVPPRFMSQTKNQKEIWCLCTILLLDAFCIGLDRQSFVRSQLDTQMAFLTIGALAQGAIALLFAYRVKKGLMSVDQMARGVALVVLGLAIVYLFATAAEFTIVQFLARFAITTCSGFLALSALVKIGDHAEAAAKTHGRSDVAKYFLFAALAALTGNFMEGFIQAAFRSSELPLDLANATLTTLSVGLIFILWANSTDKAEQGFSGHSGTPV